MIAKSQLDPDEPNFLAGLPRRSQALRRRRFSLEVGHIITQALSHLGVDRRFLEASAEGNAQGLLDELAARRGSLRELERDTLERKERHRQELYQDWQTILAEEEAALRACLTDLEAFLQRLSPEAWNRHVGQANQEAERACLRLADRLRQSLANHAAPADLAQAWEALQVPFPSPPHLPAQDLLLSSEGELMVHRLEAISLALSRTEGSPEGVDSASLEAARLEARRLREEERRLQQLPMPQMALEEEVPRTGRKLGRILGTVADMALFLIPGVSLPNMLAKAMGGLSIVRKAVEGRGPVGKAAKKLGILDKFNLSYWGERMGSYFDGEPQTLQVPDEQALREHQAQREQNEESLRQAQRNISSLEESIRRRDLAFQERERLMGERQRLRAEMAQLQERQKSMEEEVASLHRQSLEASVRNLSDSLVAGLGEKAWAMRSLLGERFRAHWQDEMTQSLEAAQEQIVQLERALGRARDDRAALVRDMVERMALLENLRQEVAL